MTQLNVTPITENLADGHNREMGITKQQAEAMIGGIINGWITPLADPQNYNEHGTYKEPKDRQRGEAR